MSCRSGSRPPNSQSRKAKANTDPAEAAAMAVCDPGLGGAPNGNRTTTHERHKYAERRGIAEAAAPYCPLALAAIGLSWLDSRERSPLVALSLPPNGRVDRVDVGDEEGGGLRFPNRDQALRLKRPERARSACPQRAPDLAEDVEGEGVARMCERRVARGVRLLERHAGHQSAALDARLLRRDAHPRRALAQEVAAQEEAVGRRVDAPA